MDRNTLLKTSRATFVSIFKNLIEDAVHQSMESLYYKADKSPNSQEQQHFLDARGFIGRNESMLVTEIHSKLEMLLDRGFQTAYDQFRPSFFDKAKAGPMVLLDISAFEDDLRLETITNRFRSEAGEQLRDLNIRIAILFECNDIAERENPFRPYLLTRAIILGVEASKVDPKLFAAITNQIAEELFPKIVKLYEGLNCHLSEAGVAAQLQFKPQRLNNADSIHDDESLAKLMQARQALKPDSTNVVSKNAELAVANQFARIEYLLNTLRVPQSSLVQTHTPIQASAPSPSESAFPEINPDLLADIDIPSRDETNRSVNHAGDAGDKVGGWLEGTSDVGTVLRGVLRGGGQQDVPGGTARIVTISSPLRQALHTPLPTTKDLIGGDGEVRNLLIERRESLSSLATDSHEKMTIDIVAMLFEFILKDHQVPAEVRAQLGRLQFLVLKMALMDSTLLTKKSHPARVLVNRIGSISVGLQQIDPTGEKISTEICRIVEELLASDSESTELFTKMLDQLDVFITRELLELNSKVGKAVDLVVNAENCANQVVKANTMLARLLEGMDVDPYLGQFLLDSWSYAIESVENSSDGDPKRLREIVPKLLWSVMPKITKEDRSLLLQLLPQFVPVLRDGMKVADCPAQYQKEFFDWLVNMHTKVMRDVSSSEADMAKPPSLEEIQGVFHEFVNPNQIMSSHPETIRELESELKSTIVVENRDINSAIFVQEDSSVELSDSEAALRADLEFFESSIPNPDSQDQESSEKKEEDILDRLRSGVVVEINLSGTPTLGRLNWISPNSSNLILTMQGQEAPSVISVRMFRRMLKNSRARFVEVAPLFERAVQSLLESADLVDLTHSS